MQILETTPTYYRVQLPSGQVLTIAKTPGTEAMMQAQMPGSAGAAPVAGQQAQQPMPGMADGGMIAPEYLEPIDPLEQVLGTVEAPLVYEGAPGMPAMPAVVGGGPQAGNPATGVMGRVLEPWMTAPNAGDLVGPVPGFGRVAASAGALAGDPAIRKEAGDVAGAVAKQAKGITEVKAPGEAAASEAAEAAPVQQQPGPELDMDLAQLLQPSWLPGQQGGASGPAPDPSALNRATAELANTQANEAEQLAAHYASMKPAGAPPNQPVDPGQFYERVGRMFGANSPKSARMIGGIFAGLVAAVGEIGAALTHRQNVAAGMIQNAIAENIRQQEGANTLSRQQWLDQTAYATQLSNLKIQEIAAKAKAPEIRAQAHVLIAKNNLAYLGARVKDGSMTAAEIAPLAKIEDARAAIAPFATKIGTTPAGPGAAIREKMGGVPIIGDVIGPDKEADAAIADRDAANVAFLRAMEPNSDRPVNIADGYKRYGNVLLQSGDYGETLAWKAKKMLQLIRSSEAIYGARARGQDPKGMGTVTPNARPN